MPTHLDNEQSIVAAAQAGDSDAFITLLNQYSRHIYPRERKTPDFRAGI